MTQIKQTVLGAVLLIIIGGIIAIELGKPERAAPRGTDIPLPEELTASEKSVKYERAKEISTPDAFINTEPVTVAELIGEKVILVDFWTYSCINCQRTTPYLNAWHAKYAGDGLVIFGIHTPEFEFEKNYENVKRAVREFDIEYPVILDNDFSTWQAYGNRYWPRKYLIDADGFIVYDHIGEGAYEETERKIVELLNELKLRKGGSAVGMNNAGPTVAQKVDFSNVKTPETYLGSSRLEYIANLPSVQCFDTPCRFEPPKDVVLNTFALDGTWKIESERAVLAADEGRLTIRFSASKVNLVAEALNEPVHADIHLDDAFTGTVTIDKATLYNLVDFGASYGEHLLEIIFRGEGAAAYVFTFG